MTSDDPPCFAVDTPLGKLARKLRLLGFDAVYHGSGVFESWAETCERHRILLTRNAGLKQLFRQRQLIPVVHNNPDHQLRQVIAAVPIRRQDIRPFSRCLDCNQLLEPIDKVKLKGSVADHIWETHTCFTHCIQCGKVFWPGSHRVEAERRLAALFNDNA